MNRCSLVRIALVCFVLAIILPSCGSSKRARGCATTSSGMGAEKVLAGEKPEKKQKFKIKGMN
jgi:hypothetical protein